jgi:hypothetical protein
MSTVAGWQWKEIVVVDRNFETDEGVDFSNFKYFFRVSIANCETVSALIEALGDNTGPMDFKHADTSMYNALWPILGSPKGNGIAWLLRDHKKLLNGKSIEKITVWREYTAYHFWATIL